MGASSIRPAELRVPLGLLVTEAQDVCAGSQGVDVTSWVSTVGATVELA